MGTDVALEETDLQNEFVLWQLALHVGEKTDSLVSGEKSIDATMDGTLSSEPGLLGMSYMSATGLMTQVDRPIDAATKWLLAAVRQDVDVLLNIEPLIRDAEQFII